MAAECFQQEEIDCLNQEIENYKTMLQKEREANRKLSEKCLRLQAAFESFCQRKQREKADLREHSMRSLLKNLLPLLDSFELALASAEENIDLQGSSEGCRLINTQLYSQSYSQLHSQIEGWRLIYSQLMDILQKEGLSYFPSLGEPFDPRKHEVIMQVISCDCEENRVVEEFKKGYYLNGQLLRPAMVAISRRRMGRELADFEPAEEKK
ncbi:MAG: nucleotide exchange factor GrpE [bacterium]|nr:nucleotide exchange factor GrpE [bacterium]